MSYYSTPALERVARENPSNELAQAFLAERRCLDEMESVRVVRLEPRDAVLVTMNQEAMATASHRAYRDAVAGWLDVDPVRVHIAPAGVGLSILRPTAAEGVGPSSAPGAASGAAL